MTPDDQRTAEKLGVTEGNLGAGVGLTFVTGGHWFSDLGTAAFILSLLCSEDPSDPPTAYR